MSSVYTPTPVALANITIPSDGDAKSAASVNAPLEAIADGVKYNTDTATTEASTRAAADTAESARTTPLANLAALTALAAPADQMVRHVVGQGFFVFLTAGSAGFSPFALAADDATPGAWIASSAHQTTRTGRVFLNREPISASLSGSTTLGPVTLNYAVDFANATATEITRRAFGFLTKVGTAGSGNWHFLVPLDDDLVDGATLTQATLYCRPANSHVGLPTRQISVCLIRSTYTGSSGAALPNPDKLISTPASGHVALAAGSTGAYQADQALVYVPDQNNVIDKSLYTYAAIIADEGGTNGLAGAAFAMIDLTMTGIPDARRS